MGMLSLLLSSWWRSGFILDVDLVWGENAPDAVDEGQCILLGPEINVEGVEFIVIYVLVSRVVAR